MAFRPLLTKRAALSLSAIGSTIAAGTLVFPAKLHTEAATPIGWESPIESRPASASPPPPQIRLRRKPIYDEPTPYQEAIPEAAQPTLSPSTPSEIRTPPSTAGPTTTDKLTSHVRTARLFLHAHIAAAEDSVNRGLNRAFEMENNFTSTIASLAPAPETGEKLLPGGIYVVVTAMAGSIMTRNRGLLLRGTVPIALGVTAGWILIPHTMRNVSDLVWTWEEKVPAIANNHLLVRGFLLQGSEEVKVRGDQFGAWLEGVARQGREAVEGLVEKAR